MTIRVKWDSWWTTCSLFRAWAAWRDRVRVAEDRRWFAAWAAEGLVRCERIDRALSGRPYEVLIIDDGSSDGTLEVLTGAAAAFWEYGKLG